MLPIVANLLATSRCNGIWETTRHNRHNGLFARANLLRTCYGLAIRGNWCKSKKVNVLCSR